MSSHNVKIMSLPIDEVLPRLHSVLRARTSAVLQAPPGAGKTTRVPPAFLEEPWLDGRRIIMLEPRRLAARAAAQFMARTRGEDVAETVGYRIRFDTRIGARTRIEVVTEGVLTRLLQDDPALEDYGIVIFDEFHERSLHADTGLALTLQTRSLLRADLRVLVMSATLHGEPIAQLLDDAEIVTSEGRSYPVETIYLDRPRTGYIEPVVAQAVRRAIAQHEGDALVFLPGAAEIHRTHELLSDVADATTAVLPLYGNLTQAEQDRAIAPSPPGRRKIVLATSIAETSLTIEGVRIVIDSGLMRVPRFDVRTGMTRLDTVTVSKASADQRRGRAGRVAPGVCYRLWTQHEQESLVPHNTPEILEADLAPLALDLAAWGVADPTELAWLDPPPANAYAQARALLRELDALDNDGQITEHGKRIARLPVHPRLGHMLLHARELGCGALGCDIAALLGGRDIIRVVPADPDLHIRLLALRGQYHTDVDRAAVQRVRREADHLRRALRVSADSRGSADSRVSADRRALADRRVSGDRHDPVARADRAAGATPADDMAGVLLALAYPDRIAQKREQRGRFLLRNGRGAVVDAQYNIANADYIVAAQLDGRGRDSRVFLASELSGSELRAHFGDQITLSENIELVNGKLRAIRREQLGALVLAESVAPVDRADADTLAHGLLHAVRERGIDALPWTDELRNLQKRVAFLRQLDERWPDLSDAQLLATLETWLLPMLAGVTALSDVDLEGALHAQIPWDLSRQLDELAPAHLQVPTGSHIRINYSDPAAPSAAVRLQEVFGMTETPRIGGGRVPLTIQLLSPAQRPVQVTRDLASFWRSGYFEVKKELKGRYPKHYWPDDPLVAEPTRGVRRKR